MQGNRARTGARPRRISRSGLPAVVLLACIALQACTQRPEVVIHSAGGPIHIPVEVVATPEARARGLMYRRDLAADAGMLFVFRNEMPQRFWMKNTPLPLDMVFIGKNRQVVGIVADTRPFSTNPLGVAAPSQFVLEVHAGFCARHRIETGAAVDLVRVRSAEH
jgi:uncharacterized membrane protein (UPF0127 family)